MLQLCKRYSVDRAKPIISFVIQCKFFFLFTGQKPNVWPANSCLQIMVRSCVMSSNCVWLQITFCSCINKTTLFSFLQSLQNGRSLRFPRVFINKQTRWSNDKAIIELGYRKILWFVTVSPLNYLPQPSASANSILICSPLTNHDSLLNLIQCKLFPYLSFGQWFIQRG